MAAADQVKLRKRLEALLKLPENQICADCRKRGPRWASANLGIFFCIECSGIHRNLGVHISFVRSVNLDSWTKAQVDFMEEWGNGRANEYYEANIPAHVVKPKEGDSVRVVEKFIRDKYEHKRYIAKSIPPKRAERVTNEAEESSGKGARGSGQLVRSRPVVSAAAAGASAAPSQAKAAAAAAAVPAVSLIDFMDMDSTPESAPAVPIQSQSQQSEFLSQSYQQQGSGAGAGGGFDDFGPPATSTFGDFMSSTPTAPAPAPPSNAFSSDQNALLSVFSAPAVAAQAQHQPQESQQFFPTLQPTSTPPLAPAVPTTYDAPGGNAHTHAPAAPAATAPVVPPVPPKPQVSAAAILSLYGAPSGPGVGGGGMMGPGMGMNNGMNNGMNVGMNNGMHHMGPPAAMMASYGGAGLGQHQQHQQHQPQAMGMSNMAAGMMPPTHMQSPYHQAQPPMMNVNVSYGGGVAGAGVLGAGAGMLQLQQQLQGHGGQGQQYMGGQQQFMGQQQQPQQALQQQQQHQQQMGAGGLGMGYQQAAAGGMVSSMSGGGGGMSQLPQQQQYSQQQLQEYQQQQQFQQQQYQQQQQQYQQQQYGYGQQR